MKISKLFIVCILIILSMPMTAQDLSIHQWEHRVLLIITNSTYNNDFQEQVGMLKNNETGLNDRKLIVYQILPQAYQEGLLGIKGWKTSKKLFNDYASKNDHFGVILIGLDGEIKLRQAEILGVEKLFETIDKMPMRASELKRKE